MKTQKQNIIKLEVRDNIRKSLRKANINQKWLAAKIGKKPGTVRNYLAGTVGISVSAAQRMSCVLSENGILNINASQILGIE